MAELARGSVSDRPWGRTFATPFLRGLTGQLTVAAEGKRYLVAFERGAVVAAASPLAADAAVRVALTGHLVSSSQVPEISRRQAATPDRDEVSVIAELARLGPDQALRLRRRVIAQRAARTFSVNHGEFVVTEDIELPIVAGCELDVRAVIYLGARTNLSEARMSAELDQLGAWFRLRPGLDDDLPQYGFGDVEQPIIERLRDGGTLDELEEFAASFVDARTVRAVVYALAVCKACELVAAKPGRVRARRASSIPPLVPAEPPADADETQERTAPSLSAPVTAESDSARRRRASGDPRTSTSHRAPAGESSPRLRRPGESSSPGLRTPPLGTESSPQLVVRRMASSRPPSIRRVSRTESPQSHEVKALIAQRLKLLDQGADHFALLGVSHDVSNDGLRKSYFALARQLHPDRLAALGISDEGKHAQRLFAQINSGFAVLSDPEKRAQYLDVLRRGGEAAVRAEQARAEQLARRILEAEEAFRRGELMLRRDQPQAAVADLRLAVQLNPDEPDYHAVLAWAQFCASPDRAAAAPEARAALERTMQRAPRVVAARFYLGRIERMVGRDAEALRHFREVLAAAPGHAEAAAEVRVLESRLGGDRPGGLFGRTKR